MTEDLIKKLASLAQMDRDATSVYDEALRHITSDDVRTQFTEFKDEHEHHITEINAALMRLDGQPVEPRTDAMGHIAEWITAFRGMGGEQGSLHAMRMAEKYHNSRYAEAVTWDVGDSALHLTLERFLTEENSHLESIESRLSVHAGAAR